MIKDCNEAQTADQGVYRAEAGLHSMLCEAYRHSICNSSWRDQSECRVVGRDERYVRQRWLISIDFVGDTEVEARNQAS